MERQAATVIAGDDPLTYSRLWSQTDAFAGGLQAREITAGDAVAIRVSEPRAFVVAFYGALRTGCVPVTIPTGYRKSAIVSALNETGALAYVTDEASFLSILNGADETRVAITVDDGVRMGVDLESFLDNDGMNGSGSRTGIGVVRRSDRDRALIAYLDAASGDRRGVRYTHSALAAAARAGASVLETDGAPRHLGSLPLSNPLELTYGANAAILAGGQYVPRPDWDPETARSLLYTDAVDRTFVTPRQYDDVRGDELETDGSETRAAVDGGAGTGGIDHEIAVIEPTSAPLEAERAETIRLRGLPETGLTHVRTPDDVEAGRLGEPLAGVETRVRPDDASSGEAETGELAVSGPAVIDGYVGESTPSDDRLEAVDGTTWVRTGLRVRETADGPTVSRTS